MNDTFTFAGQSAQSAQTQPSAPTKPGLGDYVSGDIAAKVNAALTAASKSAGVRDAGASILDSLKGESGTFSFSVGNNYEEMKDDNGKVVSIWYPVNLAKADGTMCRTSTSTIRRSLKAFIPAAARRSTGDMVAYLAGLQDNYNIEIAECGTNTNGRTVFKGSFVDK